MHDEKILKVLRKSPDAHVSSEELCGITKISRAAVWKHVECLRAEGYDIEASPHLGYRLLAIPDALIPAEVMWELGTRTIGMAVISYKKIDSTNDAAYSLAENGIAEGTVVLAEEQAKGKGRHGRKWISPPKGGIYMSCVLRPAIAPNEIPTITLMAAVAVAKAIRKTTGLQAVIKWPNDILVSGRKICGILTEMKAEQDSVDFIILGIGLNVNTSLRSLPEGATSIKEELNAANMNKIVTRIEMVRSILRSLETEYSLLKKSGSARIIAEWKGMSAMLGSRIKVVLPNDVLEGAAHDIDPDGSLVLRLDSGVLKKIWSGDVVMVRESDKRG